MAALFFLCENKCSRALPIAAKSTKLFIMGKRVLVVAIVLMLYLSAGCAGQEPLSPSLQEDSSGAQTTEAAAEKLLAEDPQGPLPAPNLPPQLSAAAAQNAAPPPPPAAAQSTIDYNVTATSPPVPELAAAFLENNSLSRLQNVPLHTLPGLFQRLKNAAREAQDLSHAQGYYDGEVHAALKGPDGKDLPRDASIPQTKSESGGQRPQITAELTFAPGPLYHMGRTTVAPAAPDQVAGRPTEAKLPRTLADAGLPEGAPAVSSAVLAAVDAVLGIYHDNGYPRAAIASTRYTLDHAQKTLEAEVTVNAGEFAFMGDIALEDEGWIKESYLKCLRTWEPGEPWNQAKVEAYREALRRTGLFQSIDLDPAAEADAHGRRAVQTVLTPAPARTVGGSINYDTSFGIGVQAFWENRNYTKRGDLLRAEASVWQDLQEVVAKYRLPFAFGRDVDFIAQAGAVHQNTDAYELEAARAAAGIEYRFSPHWSFTAQGTAEGGRAKPPDEPRRSYMMLGLPLGANYSSANSLLDATRGSRMMFNLTPYNGFYDGNFTTLRSRLDLQHFQPLVGEDTLVLAMRASMGSLWGADSQNVPPSIRFYSGGGGSVRGYAYQSLGPRDSDNDPLGGKALLEVSVEPRWKVSETWGLVAFLDGGMVYDDFKDYGRDMRWGAGVGFRYYTAIGPVRFDVATPLNPRDDDSTLQFYISIGQSF